MHIFFFIFLGILGIGIFSILFFIIQLNLEDQRRAAIIRREQIKQEQLRLYEEMQRILYEHQQYANYHYQQTYRYYQSPPSSSLLAAQKLLDSYGGYKAAVKKTHPDLGGNPSEFRKVQKAKELIDKYKGII